MAVVASSSAQHSRSHTFPIQHEVGSEETLQLPFRYPQHQISPPRDSRKAQKMLGLVTDFPRRSATAEIPRGLKNAQKSATLVVPSRDPTKAQRTLGLMDSPRNRRYSRPESSCGYEGSLEEMLAQAERDVRRLSGLDPCMDDEVKQKLRAHQREEQTLGEQLISPSPGYIEIGLEQELQQRVKSLRLNNVQVSTPLIHSPVLLDSPEQLSHPSPLTPIELEVTPPQAQDGDISPVTPPPYKLPRPASFASSHSHMHSRPHSRIASSRSRGLRSSSYPNYSRPLSEIAPTPIPGEDMERDPLHIRYQDDDVGPASPLSPTSPGNALIANVREAKAQVEAEMKQKLAKQTVPERPKKTRWSSLPLSIAKFTKRSSKSEEDHTKEPKGKDKGKGSKKQEKITLTEENLQRWEDEVGYVPRMYRMGYDILRSPVDGDMEVERATSTPDPRPGLQHPQLPKVMMLTPPTSPPLDFQPSSSTPIIIQTSHNQLIPAAPLSPTPSYSNIAARKESVIADRRTSLLTCVICKEAKHPSSFPLRSITDNCWHSPSTCNDCLQQWIHTCAETRGWDQCTCPECGQYMSYDDVKTFASPAGFKRYDELAKLAALSSISDFYWCQRPGCGSGQVHTGPIAENPVFTCTACGHVHCLKHPTVPYHTNLTCAKFDALHISPRPEGHLQAEQEGQRTVQETCKRCPNAVCGWWIQKDEGCDHMTCSQCRFQFCWECGAPFGVIDRKGNKFHRRSCKYWG